MNDAVLTVPVPSQVRRAPEPADDAVVLLAAADADADALADALHDGALQALVVARYAADVAVRGGDPVVARDAVQEALVALRQVVWLLRPRGSDGLAAALGDLSSRAVVPLDLELDEEAAAGLLPSASALAYRFVQAVTGDATAGAVRVVRAGGWAVVQVDGEVADIAGWSARARAVGGRLDSPGGPARLLLPLPDSDPEGDR